MAKSDHQLEQQAQVHWSFWLGLGFFVMVIISLISFVGLFLIGLTRMKRYRSVMS